MRLVLSWLREYCPVELSAEALGDLLAAKGMHVESIERPWAGLDGVVVAKVLEVRDHPNSDKLCLARIDVGGAEREIVVGVRNMVAGDLVPYAGPGARVPALPEPLSARDIRGVVSEGMICSARELGISAEHSGILILGPNGRVGADVKRALGLDEAVLDLEIETNRPDLLSVLGIAREVAGATGLPLTPPDTSVAEGEASAEAAASIEVDDRKRCPRYLARVIHGVVDGPSPLGVQARLTAAGMRPLSAVVDATNYVMLEMGQPMHPFDMDLLAGGIVVRRASDGERLRTLDDVDRLLTEDDLLIADHEKPVGIAGVMGSASAEVSASTTNVLLESAYFEPRGILRTSRRLLLPTEAAIRFSRGCDPEGVAPAAARAAALMVSWTGSGTVRSGAADVGAPPPRRRIGVRPERASLLVGHEVSASDIAEALGRIGIASEKRDGVVLAEAPSFRPDLELEVDLIEEVARVQGYDALRSTVPGIQQAGGLAADHAFRRRLREAMVRAGLREAVSLSFASSADLDLMGHSEGVRIANPPSADQPFLRTSLVPGLVQAVGRTISRGVRSAALFEVGHVFRPADPVDEREMVAAILCGPVREGHHGEPRELDLFDAKGALESLFAALSIHDGALGEPAGPPMHPGRSAVIELGGHPAGTIGELHPRVVERLDLPSRVAVFEIDAAALAEHAVSDVAYREIPRYPPIRRDLAFTLDAATPAGDVMAALREAGGELLGSVHLFDVFEGSPLPEGKKSLAFSVELRAQDRTLTDREADTAVSGIVERLARGFGAQLRAG